MPNPPTENERFLAEMLGHLAEALAREAGDKDRVHAKRLFRTEMANLQWTLNAFAAGAENLTPPLQADEDDQYMRSNEEMAEIVRDRP